MRWRTWIWVAVAVAAAGYFWLDVRQRARTDRGLKRHRTDFTVYQAAAHALRHGEDPYEARNPRGYRYVYPPLLAVLLQPVADWEPQDAALVFYALSVLAIIGSIVLLRRMVAGRWLPIVVASIVCLGFAHQGFQRGQVTHILLFLQVAALALLLGRRPAWAGWLLGFGGALRLTPLLPAMAVGVGLLVGAYRRNGIEPPLRFGGGLAGGMLLGFVLVPVLWLGAERASEVGDRWIQVTREVYSENVDLDRDYKINEWRFKNQAPRRVYGTYAGWIQGAPFEKERPQVGPTTLAGVDLAAGITTWALVGLVLVLAGLYLREPGHGSYAHVYALVVLLPVLMTRYTWPTHYLMAAPALVLAARRDWFAAPVTVLFLGTALFYAAHAESLLVVGQAGCLCLACGLCVFLLVRRARVTAQRRETVLLRYPGGGVRSRLYRSLRLHHGGFEALASCFPRTGLVVDLGAGAGLLAHVLVEQEPGRHVLAVDHDPGRVTALRTSAAGLPIEVQEDTLEHVVLPRCKGIALVDVAHYLSSVEQQSLIARCAHALEPGGVLVLRDPDAGAGVRFALTRLHEVVATAFGWTRGSVGTYRSVHAWAAQLQEQGLEPEILPGRVRSLYADRVVIGRRS